MVLFSIGKEEIFMGLFDFDSGSQGVIRTRDGEFEIGLSKSGAATGAVIGAGLGKWAGPGGVVPGAIIGGIFGAIVGPED
jgi:hypothetical protein